MKLLKTIIEFSALNILSFHAYKPFLILYVFALLICCSIKPSFAYIPVTDGSEDKYQEGIVWSKTIMENEVDYIKVIDQQYVLVGTLDINTGMWTKKSGKLFLMDIKSAKVKWEIDREEFYMHKQNILCAEPVILLHSMKDENAKMTYHAIDNRTGEILWEKELKSKTASYTFNHVDNELIIIEKDKDELDISFIDIIRGNITGSLLIDTDMKLKKHEIRLQLFDEYLVIIINNKVFCVSLNDNSLLWEKTYSNEEETILSFFYKKGKLVIYSYEWLEYVHINTGNVLWSLNSDRIIRNVAIYYDHLYLVTEDSTLNKGPTLLECYNSENYQKIWATEFNGSLFSPIIIEESFIYFTTITQLLSIDNKTGQLIYTRKIPDALCFDKQLVDNIEIRENKILIGRETGVAVFNKETGKLILSDYVANSMLYTSGYNIHKMNAFSLRGSDPNKVNHNAKQASLYYSSNGLERAQAWAAKSHDYTEKVMNNKTSTSSEKMFALEQEINAHEAVIIAGQTQAMEQMVTAVGNAVSQAVGATMIAVKQTQVINFYNLYTMRNILPSYLHNKSLGNTYYVRPFYDKGWYLSITNLEMAKRANVLLAPENTGNLITLPNLIYYDIVNDILITKGINMSNPQPETYEYKVYDALTLRDKKEFPCPGILAIDLNNLTFIDIEDAETGNNPYLTINESDRLFLDAIKSKDKKKYKRMLKEGANVNATDEFGLTALMYAAIIDDVNLVKALMKEGADVTATDANHWNAVFYCRFPFIASQSFAPLLQKTKKELK
ncbi:MAG: hypothetical protein K8R63_04370 [Bacteroidales bacterium]|nr:hypothetical protein [Bacteroidales bacterium]